MERKKSWDVRDGKGRRRNGDDDYNNNSGKIFFLLARGRSSKKIASETISEGHVLARGRAGMKQDEGGSRKKIRPGFFFFKRANRSAHWRGVVSEQRWRGRKAEYSS